MKKKLGGVRYLSLYNMVRIKEKCMRLGNRDARKKICDSYL